MFMPDTTLHTGDKQRASFRFSNYQMEITLACLLGISYPCKVVQVCMC